MTQTLATKKQAEAIKQRMAEIRTELPYSADQARARVQQLTDWKYHMSRHPLPMLAVAAAIGYVLIPSKSAPSQIVVHRSGNEPVAPAKKGLVGGVFAALATLAMKQAASLAVSHVSTLLEKRGTA